MSTSQAPSAMIVADDLTGATDSAVQFARAGWHTQLVLDSRAEAGGKPGSVTARVTDARALGSAEARSRTREAVAAGAGHASHLFLKIDSTLRGTVMDQISGALDVWREKHPSAVAVVCSAYPPMGRTVVDGRLLVNNVPVHETPIGRDPVTPVATSAIADLLAGSTRVARSANVSLRDALEAASAASSVLTVDASTEADIAELAEAITSLGHRAIPVGSAGLALALAAAWGDGLVAATPPSAQASRVVLVASSLHDVTLEQVDALSDARSDVVVLRPSLQQLLNSGARSQWHDAVSAASARTAPVTVIAAPTERRETLASSRSDASGRVADGLAQAAHSLVAGEPGASLVLMGGEGARAVLETLGTERVHIHRAIREGMPIGTIEGGVANGATVVTKAGGFGARTDISDIVSELLDNESVGTPL
ncbi:four-carbon acid sugar kinase family protein [Paramicrobacterium agarici]|uniref:four-carbon acid sugar kinase family protein n=1 Tax=Paramicrobacterium agarici TaxID=630514 RepID=UPI0014731676|nr:four-carbon acid sugar kinase family protein [Microbacterium agarici]